MPTRPADSTHEAEPNYPIHDPGEPGVESPSGDRMQGANGQVHATPDPSMAGPGEAMPGDKAGATANEDDATSGDQDIDTAGTAHDDLSPTKSM
jgi:hypothetical protein